jgi:hypothetical protein
MHNRFATAVVTIGANGISLPIASYDAAYSWGLRPRVIPDALARQHQDLLEGVDCWFRKTGLVDPQGAASDGPTRSIRCVTSSRLQR